MRRQTVSSQHGFTLIETTIALMIMAVVGLGVAAAFGYAAQNTMSASDRDLAMAVGQQRMEQLRNVPFGDASLIASAPGGTTATVFRNGRQYSILTIVDDSVVSNGQPIVKTITVQVTSLNGDAVQSPATLFGSVRIISTRSAMTVGQYRAL